MLWSEKEVGRLPLLIWVTLCSVLGFGFVFGVLGVCPSRSSHGVLLWLLNLPLFLISRLIAFSLALAVRGGLSVHWGALYLTGHPVS